MVVSKVKTYSIAGEDGKVERGDVIDELGKDDHNKASLTIQHTFYSTCTFSILLVFDTNFSSHDLASFTEKYFFLPTTT